METGKWNVDTDQAERQSGTVEIGGKLLSTQELAELDSSEDVVNHFNQKGITEQEALDRATSHTNDPLGTDELHIDTYATRETFQPTDDDAMSDLLHNSAKNTANDDNDSDGGGGSGNGGSSGPTFTGGYTTGGGGGGSNSSSSSSSSGSSSSGGYNGGSSYVGGGGYGF